MLQPAQEVSVAGEAESRCPDVSVIIVTWNVRDYLLQCISTLLSASASRSTRIEIIVVDNASSDGTVQAVQRLPVTLIAKKENVGYGRANNLGMQVAQGRHLLILNPDTVPQPGAIDHLYNFVERNQRAGIIAPRLINPDGTIQHAAFYFPSLPMAALDLFPLPRLVPGRVRDRLNRSRLNGRYPQETAATQPFRINHPLGACFLIRREAYEQCGGFDERIFMYSEEIDLALRYAEAGWQSWQVPASRVIHYGGQSTSQMPVRMFVELWRSRLFVYATHYPRTRQVLLRKMLRVAMLKDLAIVRIKRLLRGAGGDEIQTAKRARAVLRMLKER